jgi:hypothetical protein
MSLTDKELKQIAWDIHSSKIFCDLMIYKSEKIHMTPMIFMPILFMESEELNKFAEGDVGMLYEYMDKAGSRSINGYPQFFSFSHLSRGDTRKVVEYYDKIRKFKEEWEDEGPQKELWEKKIDG